MVRKEKDLEEILIDAIESALSSAIRKTRNSIRTLK